MFEKDFLGRTKATSKAYDLTSRIVQLMSWFAVITATLLAVMFFTFKTAHASSATCYDITGASTGVLFGSTANSGVLHFDNPTYVPALQYQACVEDNNTPLGEGPFEVKGWAWDTNLGWISFYCADEDADGPPYENLGVPCGNEIYGVTMEGLVPSVGTVSGQLGGYAWGDNAGWVNFSCVGAPAGLDSLGNACGSFDYGVTPETTDAACYGEVYGSPAPGACSDNLPEDTYIYAWSDSVGWFDFTGVQFPWIELIDAGVVVTAYLDPDPSVVGYTVPVADGSDAYKLRMVVTKTSGAAIVPEDYNFNISLNWPVSCIDLDQTDTLIDCGAISVPLTEADFNLTSAGVGGYGVDGVANAFTVYIPSFAPTSDQNGYTFSGGGYFPYETFVEGDPNSGVPIPINDLQIGQLSVSVARISDGVCAFGDDYATCTQYPVTDFNSSPHLGFQPAVDIPMLDNQSTDADTIQATIYTGQTLNYTTACRGTFDPTCGGANVDFITGVTTPEFQLVADFTDGIATCTDPTTFSMPTNLAWNSGSPVAFILTPVLQIDVSDPSGCEPTGPENGEGAYVYSTVSYNNGGNAVSYYSNKLPRVTGTLVVNPVADVKGSVYSTGVTNPQEGTSVRSIGDVSTNILRDAIFRNVSNIVAGAADPGSGMGTIQDLDGSAVTNWTVTKGVSLYPDLSAVPRVYYFTDDVTLSGASNITWDNQRTVISVGGDVYIDSNLYNGVAVSNKPRLGVIALKDFSTGKGGNVYIASDVNDIQANIFADGSVFSYDGNTANINSTIGLHYGEPCWAGEKQRHDTLINQLYIEGSIASQNTIGGAADTTPTLGNGKKVSAVEGVYGGSGSSCSPTGRSQARLYDLNFMRYYGLVFERLGAASGCEGQAKDQQNPTYCPSTPGYSISATKLSAGGDLVSPSDLGTATVSQYLATQAGEHLNAVYVYFDPPPSTLPGFGVTGGVDMTVRPR